ncbi:MAG: ATP-binding protein [Gammaproteobacteria bacterium]|nr:ATP-binding protein [Gammaproteobacteria bacterium]
MNLRSLLHDLESQKNAMDQHSIVSITDENGMMTYVNNRFIEVTGYTQDELIGQSHNILKSGVHPLEFYTELWSSLKSGSSYHCELCNKRKDGQLYWLDATFVPYPDINNLTYQYVCITTDITRRKELEARLEKQTKLLNMLNEAIMNFVEYSNLERTSRYMMNELMAITQSDCSFIGEVFGSNNSKIQVSKLSICNRENVSSYNNETFQASTSDSETDQLIQDAISSGSPLIKNHSPGNPQSAGMQPCCAIINSTLIVPVHYGNEIVGIYGLADRPGGYDQQLIDFLQPFNATFAVLCHARRSYVEQADIQQDLFLAKLAADKANDSKSEFLSRMSHELRTPLNAILGYAQLIQLDDSRQLSTNDSESINAISQSGAYLLKLINEVLDLTRIESGNIALDITDLNIEFIINDAINMVSVLAAKNNISIEVSSADFINVSVSADQLRLTQVIVNILSNAIKYNKDNGKVFISGSSPDNAVFNLSIKDTGLGISEEQQLNLFTAFDRLGAESSSIEGTGIGLPISLKLIEHMHGNLQIKSQPGSGSTFTINIPTGKTSSPTNHASQEKLRPVNLSHIENGQHKILYIEDDLANIKLVQRILEKYPSIQLLISETGLDGINTAKKERPDIILLDINLPDLTGYDVIEQLRRNVGLDTTPILAVSANATSENINRGLTAGFDHYITKPINIRIFLDILNESLAQKHAPNC